MNQVGPAAMHIDVARKAIIESKMEGGWNSSLDKLRTYLESQVMAGKV